MDYAFARRDSVTSHKLKLLSTLLGACWRGLPLQRFLPGADYASLETLLKNITRVACTTTPSPPIKYKGNETYLNASK